MVSVGLAHPLLGSGGSEARVMRAIEAIQEDHACAVISTAAPEWDRLNRTYGTNVRADRLKVLTAPAPMPLRPLMGCDAVRGSWYARLCRSVGGQFDVPISMYNMVDFGVPSIQCIADFCFDEGFRAEYGSYPSGWRKWLYVESPLRKGYRWLCHRISGKPSGLDPARNTYIATSAWAAGEFEKRYGLAASVLYPPVVGGFPTVPFESRERGFVCLGRVSPEKRVEDAIEVVARLRQGGHEVHLHVVGPVQEGSYGDRIRRLAAGHGDWVILEGGLYGNDKKNILAHHKYGLHACRGEAFGAAVAEMVKAGCIPFAHETGGPVEVVDHPALVYGSIEEAVAKIDAVLRAPALEADLRTHLAGQGKLFSPERFMAGIRQAVETFLATRGSQREVGR